MNKRMSIVSTLAAMIIILSACTSLTSQAESSVFSETIDVENEYFGLSEIKSALDSRDGYSIRAAVLYCGAVPGNGWRITTDSLKQSLAVKLEAQAADRQQEEKFSGLCEETLQDCVSYFFDGVPENYRTFPCILDYDGDGSLDAFCGSSDGLVYYYHGEGYTGSDGRLCMGTAQLVYGIELTGFSAPSLMDLDGDGQLDMIVGCQDGNLYWYRGSGTLLFEPQGVLIHTDINGQVFPNVGDIDGDDVQDLAVGSNQGILLFYYGGKNGEATEFSTKNMGAISRQCADEGFGFWLSPYLVDYDKNGTTDLLIGTHDGYVALLSGDGNGKFSFEQYITVEDINLK